MIEEASKVPGGYHYSGICSEQICFRLRDGGELRFMLVDDDVDERDPPGEWHIDYYDGGIPPGITGPVTKTAQERPGRA